MSVLHPQSNPLGKKAQPGLPGVYEDVALPRIAGLRVRRG